MLANIGGQAIEETFYIPQYKSMAVVIMDQAAKSFQDNQEAYFTHLKQNWLHEGKKGVTKSSKLTVVDFKSEYGDLIVFLNRIMGLAQSMQLEKGKKKIWLGQDHKWEPRIATQNRPKPKAILHGILSILPNCQII